jgi:hypothetical protein
VDERCFGVERDMESMVDRVEHALEVIDDLAVPEAQDAEALALEPLLTLLILKHDVIATVMPAVELDDEPRG